MADEWILIRTGKTLIAYNNHTCTSANQGMILGVKSTTSWALFPAINISKRYRLKSVSARNSTAPRGRISIVIYYGGTSVPLRTKLQTLDDEFVYFPFDIEFAFENIDYWSIGYERDITGDSIYACFIFEEVD